MVRLAIPETMTHIELGKWGEKLALQHLISKGYKLLKQNYRFKNAEIDIVCIKDGQLIITEVKTRNTAEIGEPYEAVGRSKQRQIIRVSNKFLEEFKLDLHVRFDVISIVHNSFRTDLNHIEDAFYPLS